MQPDFKRDALGRASRQQTQRNTHFWVKFSLFGPDKSVTRLFHSAGTKTLDSVVVFPPLPQPRGACVLLGNPQPPVHVDREGRLDVIAIA